MIGIGVAFQIQEHQIARLNKFVGRQISVRFFQTLHPALHAAGGDEFIHAGVLSTEAGKVGAPVGSIGVAAARICIAAVVLAVAVFINDEILHALGIIHLRVGNGRQIHQPVAGELHPCNGVFPDGFVLRIVLGSSDLIIGRNFGALRIANGDGYGVITIGIGLICKVDRSLLSGYFGGVNVRAIQIHLERHRVRSKAALVAGSDSNGLFVDDQIAGVVRNGHDQLANGLLAGNRLFAGNGLFAGSGFLSGLRFLSRLGGRFHSGFRRWLGGRFHSGFRRRLSRRFRSGLRRRLGGRFRSWLRRRLGSGLRSGLRRGFSRRFRRGFRRRLGRWFSSRFRSRLNNHLICMSMSVHERALGHGHHAEQVHDDQQYCDETSQGRV